MLRDVLSSDGSILVCGGKSSYLQIWNLETHKLIKIIELPKVIKEVKEMAFLSESFDEGSHKVSRQAIVSSISFSVSSFRSSRCCVKMVSFVSLTSRRAAISFKSVKRPIRSFTIISRRTGNSVPVHFTQVNCISMIFLRHGKN